MLRGARGDLCVSSNEPPGLGQTQGWGLWADNHREIPVVAEERPEPIATPVAPVLIDPVPVETVAPVPSDEVATVEDATVWFWELLGSCGYRRW